MTIYPDPLAKRALLSPGRTAFVDARSGATFTYADLHQQSNEFAFAFAHLGIQANDRIGILCRNRVEFFISLFACARLGAILVPLSWRMPAPELFEVLKIVRPKLIVTGHEDQHTIIDANYPARVMSLESDLEDSVHHLSKTAPTVALREFWNADDNWYLLFTSGTTGQPKAVIQTIQMAMMNYGNVQSAINLSENDHTLNYLPLFHTAGINLYTLPTLFAGGKVSILPSFDADNVIDRIQNDELNIFFGVPTIYQTIAEHPDFSNLDLSSVRMWGCGGAPLSDPLVEAFADKGALVCNGYGMTETGPTAFLMKPDQVLAKPGSVGQCQLLTSAKITNPDGTPVAPGEVGEVYFKGPSITPGYWNDDAASADAIDANGWLRSGDLATIDADGYAYIVGRSKEMFISGGENIFPIEVENAFSRHPAIAEIAVVGVPDRKWGEVGHAFVRCHSGQTVSTDELNDYGRKNLCAFKVPKAFVMVDDFPRTAAGKIQKHLLSATYH